MMLTGLLDTCLSPKPVDAIKTRWGCSNPLTNCLDRRYNRLFHPPREAGESLASYPSTWLGCFPSPISRLNELQTVARWLTHLSDCPLWLSLNHCSFMHLPTNSPIYRLCELCAWFGHCRLQTSDRNIHTIILIQHLLHGAKWGWGVGEVDQESQAGACEESPCRP